MKILLQIVLGLVLAAVIGFGFFMYDHGEREHRAAPEALAALGSDATVTVSQEKWIVFEPGGGAAVQKGLIFYPGAECDERGYAPPLRAIAAAGYLVVLAPDTASEIIAAYPQIDTWAIAGHSLGGSMAARYAFHHPDKVQGLIMWDAYPADDMSASILPTSMIHRADQAGNPPVDYEPHLAQLPARTAFHPLRGAGHLNFGGFIPGRKYRDEPPPALDPGEQMELAAQATAEFMRAL